MRRSNISNSSSSPQDSTAKSSVDSSDLDSIKRLRSRKMALITKHLRQSYIIAIGLVVVITCLLSAGFIEIYLRCFLQESEAPLTDSGSLGRSKLPSTGNTPPIKPNPSGGNKNNNNNNNNNNNKNNNNNSNKNNNSNNNPSKINPPSESESSVPVETTTELTHDTQTEPVQQTKPVNTGNNSLNTESEQIKPVKNEIKPSTTPDVQPITTNCKSDTEPVNVDIQPETKSKVDTEIVDDIVSSSSTLIPADNLPGKKDESNVGNAEEANEEDPADNPEPVEDDSAKVDDKIEVVKTDSSNPKISSLFKVPTFSNDPVKISTLDENLARTLALEASYITLDEPVGDAAEIIRWLKTAAKANPFIWVIGGFEYVDCENTDLPLIIKAWNNACKSAREDSRQIALLRVSKNIPFSNGHYHWITVISTNAQMPSEFNLPLIHHSIISNPNLSVSKEVLLEIIVKCIRFLESQQTPRYNFIDYLLSYDFLFTDLDEKLRFVINYYNQSAAEADQWYIEIGNYLGVWKHYPNNIV